MSNSVFWDTNLFVYWIEQASPWAERVQKLLDWSNSRGLKTVTSSLTLAEILVRPLSLGETATARRYKDLITKTGCIPFGAEEAWVFGEIRAQYSMIKPPDAIQLACASVHGVELFVTNDQRIKQIKVRGIKHIRTLDAAIER